MRRIERTPTAPNDEGARTLIDRRARPEALTHYGAPQQMLRGADPVGSQMPSNQQDSKSRHVAATERPIGGDILALDEAGSGNPGLHRRSLVFSVFVEP